jgi:hypothetical protein
MPVLVPVFAGEPLYNERIRLEDRDYIFRFDWADREQRFYMSISTSEEESIVQGIKVISNWPLLAHHHWDDRLPPGELIAIDQEEDGAPPVLSDFGTRVRLFYYASDEDISEIAGG